MLRFHDILETTEEKIDVSVDPLEINAEDRTTYVVYDTSTGMVEKEDYYSWRSLTKKIETSSGDVLGFTIDNDSLFPKFSSSIDNYTNLDPKLLYIMSTHEYWILKSFLTRIDLVRRRLPNPGRFIEDIDGLGDGGVVGFAGGYDKKFSIDEIKEFIEGALIEVNIHPPATNHWWAYCTNNQDKMSNPYYTSAGVPVKLLDLVVQGAMIRALHSWGILEIDLHFSTSDSGLQITYDRVGHVSGWLDRILNEYKVQKDFIKFDSVNSMGAGVGTYPYAATGIWGAAMGMIQGGSGIVPLSSMLGFHIRANTPM